MRSRLWLCIGACTLALACGDDDNPNNPDAHVSMDAGPDANDASEPDASHDDDAGFDPRAVACFDDLQPPLDGGYVSIQRFETLDGALQLWRARQPGNRSGAVGETTAYDLVRVWIDGPRDSNTCVTEPSALSYDFMHHNWNDTWTVTTDHTRYEVNELYTFGDGEPTWTDTLALFDAQGTALGSPQTLVATGCDSEPWNYGPCAQRVRLDTPPSSQGE